MTKKNGTGSQVRFLSPFDFRSPQDLFQAFFERNKEETFFSYRFLAQKLTWPVSYFKEVSVGKRSLSVQRALEFAKFARYSPLETERLVLMSHGQQVKGDIQEEFHHQIEKTNNQKLLTEKEHQSLIYSTPLVVLFEVIRWTGGALSASELAKVIRTYHFTESEVEANLKQLQRLGYITFVDGKAICNHEMPHLDEDSSGDFPGIQLHKEYAESFLSFCRRPQAPSFYTTSFVQIPRARFRELAKKMVALRNWFHQISEEAKEIPERNQTLLCQLDLNLFPIIEKPPKP